VAASVWSPESLRAISEAANQLGSSFLSYAIVAAAIGTLAMAFVEMAKNVWPLREAFNRMRVRRWMAQDAARAELELLAAGAHADPAALYDQPVEKMMGQVQAAANLALEYPEEYPALYGFLTEVPQRYWDAGAHVATRGDRERWQSSVALVHRVRAAGPAALDPGDAQHAQEAAAARARLGNLVARKLDAFQNQTQYLWERWNQRAATAAAVVFFLLAVELSQLRPDDAAGWLLAVVVGLFAGVVAPFAKQLAGSLSSFGK